ncbi:aspartate aminotransferase family protein [Marinoscillum furvescens]|uniref:Acetylornithine/succinyldiaminopimelate/putresci ne aminotransferase n=1 Tax=Marinoscillum furvescens DSM 4134 TaxID=1122208 RepID=A0A3D9L4B4_MARFU|nr:aspartate aminotransferase family protein [Marinoscillum furvescens]RED97477.1 acetylornithine/succinyldiaminopimelate/putrescine aminotransferase [Marinoscillum furvescens DSM 4134]
MLTNRQLFLDHLAQTTDFPLMIEIVNAEGIYMYDPDGKAYIDLISGIGVSSVGHRHPRVVAAAKEQLDKYMHLMVYGEYVQSPQVKLAEAITKTLPDNLDAIYLVNSGSEAVEGALKLAKRYTGRPHILSAVNAYHGSSHGALSAGGNEIFKRNYRPLVPGHSHIPFNDMAALEQINNQTAAVILETVQGEAGIRVASQDYLSAVRKRCNDVGALLILDEIQAGFGRTGKFWAFEHYDVVPDIVVSAKGMGGGMPIGAFISSKAIMDVLKENPILGHITTFGGHPVSAAASLAALQVTIEEKLPEQVAEKAALFKQQLKHPKIKEIRNLGLMMAVAFESFEVLKPIIDRAIELGVVTDWFLFCDNAMRIAPPLTITPEEIKKACSLILQAIDEVTD